MSQRSTLFLFLCFGYHDYLRVSVRLFHHRDGRIIFSFYSSMFPSADFFVTISGSFVSLFKHVTGACGTYLSADCFVTICGSFVSLFKHVMGACGTYSSADCFVTICGSFVSLFKHVTALVARFHPPIASLRSVDHLSVYSSMSRCL